MSKNIQENVINEDDEEEESSSDENEDENDESPRKKNQKGKMSDNKLLIFNLVFNINNP